MGPMERVRAILACALTLVGILVLSPPAAAGQWYGDNTDVASAAIGDGTTVDLFYGVPMLPETWYTRDRASLDAALASGDASLTTLYNQWLAIADLRAALYASAGQLVPGGLTVYPPGPSAVIHALDLALWAREQALLWMLGLGPLNPYPDFGNLGYQTAGNFIGATRENDALTPADVAGVMNAMMLPAPLFAGDHVLLMPYRMPQEYGVTDVVGPDIRIWLGSDASIDLQHVLAHELGHAIHFRFGGYDSTIDPSTGATRPLSAFWQHYLELRGLAWADPSLVPWAQRTPECFAEDVAYLVDGPNDALGYETKCPVPTTAQQAALLAWLRSLPVNESNASPFEAAGWLDWQSPWPSVDFGNFQATLFTSTPTVNVSLSLNAAATGGPYTVDASNDGSPLATLTPGSAWTGTVPVPAGGHVEVAADSPEYSLSFLEVYANPAFVPVPRISGVFPDTLDSWSRATVAEAVRRGIVGGYPDGTFRPAAPVTRAEFARMLATALPARLFARPSGTPVPEWSDVPSGAWEAPFVEAVGTDLPGVLPSLAFDPNRPVTRQEAGAWAALAMGWSPLPVDQADALLATYPDGENVSPIDASGFAAALAVGLIQGDAGTGNLRPTDTLTRAEAAVLVLRGLELRAQGE